MKPTSSLIYGGAVVIGQSLSLARVVIIAKLIGLENQGLVIILGTIVGLVESLLTLGNSWQVVQSRHGESLGFQSSLHLFNLVRGVVVAGGIAASGPLIEAYSGVDGVVEPLLALSLCSLVRGLTSLGPWIDLRNARSKALAGMELVPSLSGIVALAIAAVWVRDAWLFVITQLASACGAVVFSHLASRIPYRLSPRREYFRAILGFTIPLTGAGILYWLNMQGDRFVVLFGLPEDEALQIKEDLALYGTVTSLVVAASVALSKVMQAKVIYELSRAQDDIQRFGSRARRLSVDVSLISAGLVVGCSLAGLQIVVLLLGSDYQPVAAFILPIGFMLGLQFFRRFFYLSSMSVGNTKVMLAGNLLRLSGLGFAVGAFSMGFGLPGLAWSAVGGELFAVMGLILLRAGRPARSLSGWFLLLACVLGGGVPGLLIGTSGITHPAIALAGVVVGGALTGLGFVRLIGWIGGNSADSATES